MKKYPKIIQCDKRGQIVIPKDIRQDLGIEDGSAFWMYTIVDDGILLKKVDPPTLDDQQHLTNMMEEKADKIGISKDKIQQSKESYKKTKKGNFELI